nr:dynamin family protein [Moritella viscosa]SHO18076.1 Putative uncharacterized protein [Moritella viscosa]
MSLFNKNDIVVASREATLQIIEQIKTISKDVHLSDIAREDFNEKLGFLKNNTEKLSLILSVVGIMKAGKSTLINSIVGSEILPSRGTAMTVIPTYIKHNETTSGVIYKFKHADKFSIFLSDLQKTGFIHSLENSALSKRLNDENFVLHKELNNLEHIHEQLEVINDLCRISMSDSNTYELILDAFKQDDFPVLETCFKSIKDLEAASDISNFVLVDTPGVNEAKLPKLKEIVNKQISRSSALLLVLNYTDLASDADENMRSKIVSEATSYKDRLIVAVNRFDAKDQKSMKKNETIRYVKEELLDEIELDNDFIFPVSARNALLGRQSLDWLEKEGPFNLSTLQGWQRDFLDNTTSGEWDEDDEDDLETINDIAETKRHAKKLLKSSRIGDFINTAINRAYQNAGPDTLIAALSGLRRLIKDSLSFTLEADLDSATRTISELKNRITALERALKSLNDLSYSTNQKLTFWHKNTSSVINEYLDEKVSKLKNISSESEQSNEITLSFKHRKEAEAKEKAEKAKKDLFEKINIEFTTIEADIQKKIQSSVVDISHSIEKDVNGFSAVLEHEVLDGFKMSTKSLDFKITFDSDAVHTKEFVTESKKTHKKPREVFGFRLSWLPKFTYAEYTTTSYNVDAIKLVQSITKMLENSLKDQMIEFRDQLKIIVADYEKDIALLCEIIRHSSKEAIENVNISTEEQLQKKSFCDYQLNELDNIDKYALEVNNGLNEIRGAV